jgi:hypothetical protein
MYSILVRRLRVLPSLVLLSVGFDVERVFILRPVLGRLHCSLQELLKLW